MMLMIADGFKPRWVICAVSSHTRIEYWPIPKTLTSATPGRRARRSRNCRLAKLLRNNALCAELIEVTVIICNIAVDFFLVETPCCWTEAGRFGKAILTRFWTATWA